MRRIVAVLIALTAGLAVVPALADEYSALRNGPQCKPFERGAPRNPSWAERRRMTVIVDSVLLSGMPSIRNAKPCWRVHARGRPALMIRTAADELRAQGRPVAKTVVIGLGYNSLWQHNRRNFRKWAAMFDDGARRLLRVLTDLGAEQFVWVTLREPTAATVPPSARDELRLYSWYFPYVNERLHRLDRRRDDLVLADWAAVSRRNGITYDSIHLNSAGGKLMAQTIRDAIFAEAKRQAQAGRAG